MTVHESTKTQLTESGTRREQLRSNAGTVSDKSLEVVVSE